MSQTREKFKRCAVECWKTALTIKAASEIKRFQENKQYGSWFSKLLPLITSMDSAQLDQSNEPSANADTPQNGTDDELSTDVPGSSKGTKGHLFTPAPETTKKFLKNATEKMLTKMSSTMKEIKDVLVDDPTNELIDYIKEESRKRQRLTRCLSLMANLFSLQQAAAANKSVYYSLHNGLTQPPTGSLMHILNKCNQRDS